MISVMCGTLSTISFSSNEVGQLELWFSSIIFGVSVRSLYIFSITRATEKSRYLPIMLSMRIFLFFENKELGYYQQEQFCDFHHNFQYPIDPMSLYTAALLIISGKPGFFG